MKSLKELLEIKNSKSLNESFKSSIMSNIVKSTDMLPTTNLAIIFYKIFKCEHFDLVSTMLLCEVAKVFKKYINSDDSSFENYKQDIFEVFSVNSINSIEDEIFDTIIKQGSLNSIKAVRKNFKDELSSSIVDFDYKKKQIIWAFSEKFNNRNVFDENGNKKRELATFELAEFTDDLFDKFPISDIDKVKPGLSPMIVTNTEGEVSGVTLGRDVLFSIDPQTIIKPGEELPVTAFSKSLQGKGGYCHSFPIKIHMYGEPENYSKYISEMRFLFADEATRPHQAALGMPNKTIMKYIINQVDEHLSKSNGLNPIKELHYNIYDNQGNAYTSWRVAIRRFLSHFMDPSNYYLDENDFVKAINPFNFTVCCDNVVKYQNAMKYKDYVNEVSKYDGFIYVLKKELYKEKKNKNTGVLEPVNKQFINPEKYESRQDWYNYEKDVKQTAVRNLQRYQKILNSRGIENVSSDIVGELSKMLKLTNDILKCAFKISNSVSDKIYDYLDPIISEPKIENNYKRLNTLYGKDDSELFDDKYSYDYKNRNAWAYTSLAPSKQMLYTKKLSEKTVGILEETYYSFDIVQSCVVDLLEEFLSESKDKKYNFSILTKPYLKVEKSAADIITPGNGYRQAYIDKLVDIGTYWTLHFSKNMKEVFFNDDEDEYDKFIENFEKLNDKVKEFDSNYKVDNIRTIGLKKTYKFLEKLKKQSDSVSNLKSKTDY